ncbi:MAG: hypothetical protein M3367_01500 [Acidobacteriota bacterium]|nr:hypothetical protein [Acidobacteriota bacterium]
MSSSQKQRFSNQRQAAQTQNRQAQDFHSPEISEAEVAEKSFPEKPSYLKYAFANPYNLALFGGAVAASVLTLNPFIAVAALGLESLWLLHGSQSRSVQRLLWDPIFEKEKAEFDSQQRLERVKSLSQHGQNRVSELIEKEEQIKQLAAQNPSFTGDLLRNELAKTSHLVNAFIELGLTCARYENYLNSIDVRELENQKLQWQRFVEANKEKSEDVEIQIARKNLAVITKRIERVGEIRRYLKIAYGQLNLLENSFQLIADQIVTMQSPSELSGQLDELLDGVESIKETARETEQILRTL